jgi:hypothetical protein
MKLSATLDLLPPDREKSRPLPLVSGRTATRGGLARAILEEHYAAGKIKRELYEKLLRELGWED